MNRKRVALSLVLLLVAALISGCSVPASVTQNSTAAVLPSPADIQTVNVDLTQPKDAGLSDFDNRLIEYLKQTGKEDQSFTVSPLSFKAALALAASGAEGETQRQLLETLGFSSQEAMEDWYQTVLAGVDAFEAENQSPFLTSIGQAYQVVNSVWRNDSIPGQFQEDYQKLVEEVYRAEVHTEPAGRLTGAINEWVREKTNGMIPQIVNNASDSAAILVNALYLKTAWIAEFHESEQTEFTTSKGTKLEKSFMERLDAYRYYEDEACQLVELPLRGGIKMVLVLGDDAEFAKKLQQAKTEEVRVVMPKLEVETSFENRELCGFLMASGCDRIFNSTAEFRPMFTEDIYVDDIIQKAKVKVNETGMEAAAATAIITKNMSAMPGERAEPKLFLADRPFTFYVINGDEAPELLFWGQNMD